MGIPRTTAAVGAAALVLKAAFEALPRAVDPQKARATPEVPLRQLDSTGATCSVLKNRRGCETYVRHWASKAPVRGVVLITHGFSWHSAWFAGLAATLTAAGFEVYSFDLQGHGRSGTVDGIRGFAETPDDWVSEMAQVADFAMSRNPGKKLFVLGESMGGSLVLRALLKGALRQPVAGVVLTGPLIRVAASVLPPPPVVFVVKLMARVFPRASVPTSEIADTFDGAFGDKAIAKRAREDPLVIFDNPRLRAAANVLALTAENARHLDRVSAPLLVLHGTLDTRSEPAHSEELVRRAASTDKTLRLVEGAHHQLFQDKKEITETVMKEVVAWLTARAAEPSSA